MVCRLPALETLVTSVAAQALLACLELLVSFLDCHFSKEHGLFDSSGLGHELMLRAQQ